MQLAPLGTGIEPLGLRLASLIRGGPAKAGTGVVRFRYARHQRTNSVASLIVMRNVLEKFGFLFGGGLSVGGFNQRSLAVARELSRTLSVRLRY